ASRHAQAARAEPFRGGPAKPRRRRLAQLAPERIVEAVGAKAKIVLANWDEVEANAWLQVKGPVVVRHARQNVFMGKLPACGHNTVLDPKGVIVFPPQRDIETRILCHLIG